MARGNKLCHRGKGGENKKVFGKRPKINIHVLRDNNNKKAVYLLQTSLSHFQEGIFFLQGEIPRQIFDGAAPQTK